MNGFVYGGIGLVGGYFALKAIAIERVKWFLSNERFANLTCMFRTNPSGDYKAYVNSLHWESSLGNFTTYIGYSRDVEVPTPVPERQVYGWIISGLSSDGVLQALAGTDVFSAAVYQIMPDGVY